MRSDQTRPYNILSHNATVLEPIYVMYLRNFWNYAKKAGKTLTDQDLRYYSGL